MAPVRGVAIVAGITQDCRGSVGLHYKVAALSDVSGRHRRFGGFMFEGLFQPMHLLVIFAIALLVFGPKKLPELGKGLGEGIRALKNGMRDNDAKPAIKPEAKPATPENNPENKA